MRKKTYKCLNKCHSAIHDTEHSGTFRKLKKCEKKSCLPFILDTGCPCMVCLMAMGELELRGLHHRICIKTFEINFLRVILVNIDIYITFPVSLIRILF